ncbi:MAG: hypothetical protein GF313_07220 [Caldithrix sp.]|nr:hypothetical protein [Caldithrix sp.]
MNVFEYLGAVFVVNNFAARFFAISKSASSLEGIARAFLVDYPTIGVDISITF